MRCLVATLAVLICAPLFADLGSECQRSQPLAPTPAPKTVKLWGIFSDVRGNGDHAYGRTVTVLEDSSGCFGFINVKDGQLEGGVGLLTKASCDKKFGTLRFETDSLFFLGNDEVGPQEYHSKFSGAVKGANLTGTFEADKKKIATLAPEKKPDLAVAWMQYASLNSISQCVDERLAKAGTEGRAILRLPTNEYSRAFDKKVTHLLCASRDMLLKSDEKLIAEKLALLLPRLKDNTEATACLTTALPAGKDPKKFLECLEALGDRAGDDPRESSR